MVEKVKGSWEIQNLKGVMKRFKSPESEEAKAWMSNRDLEVVKAEKVAKAPKVLTAEKQAAQAKRELNKAIREAKKVARESAVIGVYKGERDGIAISSH